MLKDGKYAPSKFNRIDNFILFDKRNFNFFFLAIFFNEIISLILIIFFVISINYSCIFILFINVTFFKFIYKVIFFKKFFMHNTVENLISIQEAIKSKLIEFKVKGKTPKIIAVSKTFKIDHILPLVEYGHLDFGENKVQEAVEKWTDIKNKMIKLIYI